MNYYVFYTRPKDPISVYERTCGTQDAADRRCGDGFAPFVMLNALPPEFYY